MVQSLLFKNGHKQKHAGGLLNDVTSSKLPMKSIIPTQEKHTPFLVIEIASDCCPLPSYKHHPSPHYQQIREVDFNF
jgi:hypothetical protein